MKALSDGYGRCQDYLRLSVTDRCNFRCLYCVPPEGISLCPEGDLLTVGEIEFAVRVLAKIGIRKVRVTGGEPLLRRDIVQILSRLKGIDGIETLVLTTNGDRLEGLARPLQAAGLQGVNVSIDSLDAERFKRVTGGGDLGRVWKGILASLDAGLEVKLNCVATADLSLEEAARFAGLARDLAVEVRFIEFMPLCGQGWSASTFVPLGTIEEHLRKSFPLDAVGGLGVARRFRVRSGAGALGFIASTSRPFCERCNRLRLTARGRLHTCLFAAEGSDLRGFLRSGDLAELEAAVRAAVVGKPRIHGGDRPFSPGSALPAARIRVLGG